MNKKENNVYIVTKGEYSDYGIIKVFSTKKRAEEFIGIFSYEGMEIEKWEMDDIRFQAVKDKRIYFIRMKSDGTVDEIEDKTGSSYIYWFRDALNGTFGFDIDNKLVMSVFAKDKNHAVKIVNEKRVQLLEDGRMTLKISDEKGGNL